MTDGNDRGRTSFRCWLMTSGGSAVMIYTVGLIVVGREDAVDERLDDYEMPPR